MDYTDALKELKALKSTGDALKADLAELARKVSIDAQGVNADATTVLYSGKIRDTRSSDIINSMGADSSVQSCREEMLQDLREAFLAYKTGGIYATCTEFSMQLDIEA